MRPIALAAASAGISSKTQKKEKYNASLTTTRTVKSTRPETAAINLHFLGIDLQLCQVVCEKCISKMYVKNVSCSCISKIRRAAFLCTRGPLPPSVSLKKRHIRTFKFSSHSNPFCVFWAIGDWRGRIQIGSEGTEQETYFRSAIRKGIPDVKLPFVMDPGPMITREISQAG